MSARVLPFPRRHDQAMGALAQTVSKGWVERGIEMVRIAVEIMEQDRGELRAKVDAIKSQGAEGLLDETDRALEHTATDLAVLIGTVSLARQKLRVARWVMAPEPPTA